MKKKFVASVKETNYGSTVIEADTKEEAKALAKEVYNAGNFIWMESDLSEFEVDEVKL